MLVLKAHLFFNEYHLLLVGELWGNFIVILFLFIIRSNHSFYLETAVFM